MAPHCDTLDGPVVKAAKRALETGNVKYILPWVHKEAEEELRGAFDTALQARNSGNVPSVTNLIDLWFYETAVRLHREGEGAPYTGLKPSGLDEGPVVSMADKAIASGDAREVIQFLSNIITDEMSKRFAKAMSRKHYDENDVEASREYVQAVLGFIMYAHHLYEFAAGGKDRGQAQELHDKEQEKKEQHKAEIIKKASKLGHSHVVEKEI